MIKHKPRIGALIEQTYENRGEMHTRIGRVVGFERWAEQVRSEFDQTGKGEGAVVVVCEYVDPKRDTTFGFGIPNHTVKRIWDDKEFEEEEERQELPESARGYTIEFEAVAFIITEDEDEAIKIYREAARQFEEVITKQCGTPAGYTNIPVWDTKKIYSTK